jgi:hypothetical protein
LRSFIADIFCSMPRVFTDLQYTVCIYTTGTFLTEELDDHGNLKSLFACDFYMQNFTKSRLAGVIFVDYWNTAISVFVYAHSTPNSSKHIVSIFMLLMPLIPPTFRPVRQQTARISHLWCGVSPLLHTTNSPRISTVLFTVMPEFPCLHRYRRIKTFV